MRENVLLPKVKLQAKEYCMFFFAQLRFRAGLFMHHRLQEKKMSLCLMIMLSKEMEKISTNLCAVAK